MNRVEEDIRAFILANVSAASGRTFCGPIRDPGGHIPEEAVFVLQTGGLPPHGYMDGLNTDYRVVRIQCRIRSEVGDYSGGKTLAGAISGLLQRAHLGSPGYVACRVAESAPLYWGKDDKEHHEWSVNAAVEVED